MHSGNKITNTRLIHLQYPQPLCQRQWQLPKTPMPTCTPCKLRFTGYFYSRQLWQQNTTTGTKHIHDRWKQSNRRPRPLITTTYPPAVDMEAQKCASMSRQHRLLALSASDDVAGTWKHISVASTSAPVPYTTPLCCHDNPMAWNGPQGEDFAGGFWPPAYIFPFKASHQYWVPWNEWVAPQRHPCRKYYPQKHKNAAGVANKRFGASRRCWQWLGANMHPISTTPTSRESIVTPWRVSGQ